MRSHFSILIPRMIRAALRVDSCRFRVCAVGIDSKNRIISIATNTPRLPTRGMHAEERVMHRSPGKLLDRILLLRVGAKGHLLPIDPCPHCQKLADKKGIKIELVKIKIERILNA